MSFIIIIPARYASTRLPGKPLADIVGKSMIHRVYEQCLKSSADRVVVATDDVRIEDAVKAFGGEVVMTSADHFSGTDRLQEVVDKLQLDNDDIVVNVQGDEPLIPASIIHQVAGNLAKHPEMSIATLCEKVTAPKDVFNPNVVKVVFDVNGRALYFSRAPIPWSRDTFSPEMLGREGDRLPEDIDYYRHIGMYAYRVSFLHDYVSFPPAGIEKAESLEQLRAMAYGKGIHVEEASASSPIGIDTPEDLGQAREWFSSNA